MRIAQVAPWTEAVPPKFYGGMALDHRLGEAIF
jgi:hypothetical protein